MSYIMPASAHQKIIQIAHWTRDEKKYQLMEGAAAMSQPLFMANVKTAGCEYRSYVTIVLPPAACDN
jgi:hypothetical protein